MQKFIDKDFGEVVLAQRWARIGDIPGTFMKPFEPSKALQEKVKLMKEKTKTQKLDKKKAQGMLAESKTWATMKTYFGAKIVKPGNWVINKGAADFHVMTDEEFKADYIRYKEPKPVQEENLGKVKII